MGPLCLWRAPNAACSGLLTPAAACVELSVELSVIELGAVELHVAKLHVIDLFRQT
jgi:hypothetical protein